MSEDAFLRGKKEKKLSCWFVSFLVVCQRKSFDKFNETR